jgi:hypothetical protein
VYLSLATTMGDRLADVVDLAVGQRVLGPAMGQRGVRDEQRQRFGHRAGEVVVGVHGDEAVDVECAGHVDVADRAWCVRANETTAIWKASWPRSSRYWPPP